MSVARKCKSAKVLAGNERMQHRPVYGPGRRSPEAFRRWASGSSPGARKTPAHMKYRDVSDFAKAVICLGGSR